MSDTTRASLAGHGTDTDTLTDHKGEAFHLDDVPGIEMYVDSHGQPVCTITEWLCYGSEVVGCHLDAHDVAADPSFTRALRELLPGGETLNIGVVAGESIGIDVEESGTGETFGHLFIELWHCPEDALPEGATVSEGWDAIMPLVYAWLNVSDAGTFGWDCIWKRYDGLLDNAKADAKATR